MESKKNCWQILNCRETQCPVYNHPEHTCWLTSGTFCHKSYQDEFIDKVDTCLECEVWHQNMDVTSLPQTLRLLTDQFTYYKQAVVEKERQIENISIEMAIGISEVFEGLKKMAAGDPSVRISEDSEIELLRKLKKMVNTTAKDLAEIVNMSHEFAIGLAEQFDVLHRVKNGDLTARVSGQSEMEILESLKNLTNQMIESVGSEISKRELAEKDLYHHVEILNNILSTSPIGIGLFDNQSFQWVNDAMLHIFRFDKKEDYIGKSASIIYPSDDEYNRVSEIMLEMLKKNKSARVDAILKRKDGTTFNGHIKISCPDPRNPLKRAIFTISDETWRIKIEEEKNKKEKLEAILEVTGTVCHELNQPMQIISGLADILALNISADNPMSDKIQKIQQQVERMGEITKKLAQITRYETRDYTRNQKILDLDKSSSDSQ